MAERRSADRRAARDGQETTWLFLRTLIGLLLLGWLGAALFSPPDPLTFLVALAPLWLVAAVAAWWLVYLDGFQRLRTDDRYRPGLSPSKALGRFVLLALILKVLGTAALNLVTGTHSYAAGVAVSLASLVLAGALVVSGWLARATGEERDR